MSGLNTTTARQRAKERISEELFKDFRDSEVIECMNGKDWVAPTREEALAMVEVAMYPVDALLIQVDELTAEIAVLVGALTAERVAYVAVAGLAEANRRAAITAEALTVLPSTP